MLPAPQHVNLHPHLQPRLQRRVSHGVGGTGREDGSQHHAEAAQLGGALVDVAVLAEVAVWLDGVGDSCLRVYVGEFAAGRC